MNRINLICLDVKNMDESLKFYKHLDFLTIYHKLLNPKKTKDPKVSRLIEAISALYWTIIVAVYLALSFLLGSWYITWVIFPVSCVIFAGIVAFIEWIKKMSK